MLFDYEQQSYSISCNAAWAHPQRFHMIQADLICHINSNMGKHIKGQHITGAPHTKNPAMNDFFAC